MQQMIKKPLVSRLGQAAAFPSGDYQVCESWGGFSFSVSISGFVFIDKLHSENELRRID